jgi:hypothetical protein
MCPVKILPGFIPVHLDCNLLLHSRRPSIVCPRCVHVYSTGIQIANAAVEVEGTPDVESVRWL